MARFEGQGLAGFIHKPYQRQQLAEALKKLFAE
jgi:FixJ family two-component response regulator